MIMSMNFGDNMLLYGDWPKTSQIREMVILMMCDSERKWGYGVWGVYIDSRGNLQGVSVNSENGLSITELANVISKT